MTAQARVIHLHFGKEGGAERFFVNLARAFDQRGVEQRFFIRPDRSWGEAIAALGPVEYDNFRRISLTRWLTRRKLDRHIAEFRPDAVMSWMPRASQLQPRNFDGTRLVRLGDYPANLKHFGHCDMIVGNTPGITAHCDALGWDRGLATISNFPRWVTPEPVPRAQHDTPEDAPLVVTGGRFVPRKGMDVALRAVAQIPGARLWLVGDGKERDALEQLARELGIADRTRFVGWVDEPIHHIASGDAFVLPSRHEPLGNVLLEAWKAGVPSVSSRCEGPAWFMRDGEDGLMADIDDVDGTAAALSRLLGNRDAARKMAISARERLEAMFSEDAVCDAYMRLFRTPQDKVRTLR